MMNNKGIVLLISMVVMAVILVILGAHFSSLLSEKKAADVELLNLQALGMAEAGVNHALAELNRRVRQDLENAIEATAITEVRNDLQGYRASSNTLGLLQKYALFNITGTNATVVIPDTALTSWGAYNNTKATVTGMPAGRTPCNENPSLKKPVPDTCTENCNCTTETDVYRFYYDYLVESQGQASNLGFTIQRKVALGDGNFNVTVYPPTYARFALFTNHHTMPNGTTVWFTGNTKFFGPVHTNTWLAFANNPSGIFNGAVTQVLETAQFYNNSPSNNLYLDADSNSPFDMPTFNAGFTRGTNSITPPPTQADLQVQAAGGQNPGFWSNGVYVKNSADNVLGGIYIRGSADSLTMSVDALNRPVYSITTRRSGSPRTTNVTVDYAGNHTILTGNGWGDSNGIYNGIPDGLNNKGTIVYSDGAINNFSGTVQQDTKATVSANNDIVVSNNVVYQNYTPDNPATTDVNELSAQGYNNLLGILSCNGNVRIGTNAPDDINIHGVVMATGNSKMFSVDSYDNYGIGPRGVVTLLGGAITDYYGPFGKFSGATQLAGYGRNFVYDSRMLSGQTPPYFPFIQEFTSTVDGLDKKLTWQEKR